MASVIDSSMVGNLDELVESFSIQEIKSIVDSQITNPEFDVLGDTAVDQFTPIIIAFGRAIDTEDDPDNARLLEDRLTEVCRLFTNAIEDRYAIALADQIKDSDNPDLIDTTEALYYVFVLHHMMHVEQVLTNYILINKQRIIDTFTDSISKKDASTFSKGRRYNTGDAIILSKIYDVGSWILDNLSADEFFQLADHEEEHVAMIMEMYDHGDLTGVSEGDPPVEVDFVDRISQIYKSNISYQGILCNNLIQRLSKVFVPAEDSLSATDEIRAVTTDPHASDLDNMPTDEE